MNKYQEAFRVVKEDYLKGFCDYEGCFMPDDELKLLEELVDRATPKKPLDIFPIESTNQPQIIRSWGGKCPNCGEGMRSDAHSYFHDSKDCGQALKWRD